MSAYRVKIITHHQWGLSGTVIKEASREGFWVVNLDNGVQVVRPWYELAHITNKRYRFCDACRRFLLWLAYRRTGITALVLILGQAGVRYG